MYQLKLAKSFAHHESSNQLFEALVTMSPAISAKEMRTMPKSSQAQTQSEPQKKPLWHSVTLSVASADIWSGTLELLKSFEANIFDQFKDEHDTILWSDLPNKDATYIYINYIYTHNTLDWSPGS